MAVKKDKPGRTAEGMQKSRTNNTPTTAKDTPNNEPNTEDHRAGQHPERLHGPKSGEEPRSGTHEDQ